MDIKPVKQGHILVIPKYHADYFFNMEDKDLAELAVWCKPLARILIDVFEPRTGKVAMLFIGTGVPHVHVHLFPIDEESDINPQNSYEASQEEIETNQQKIIEALGGV